MKFANFDSFKAHVSSLEAKSALTDSVGYIYFNIGGKAMYTHCLTLSQKPEPLELDADLEEELPNLVFSLREYP